MAVSKKDNSIVLQIEKLEKEIKESKQKLAALRKKAAPVKVDDYTFLDSYGAKKNLSQLFVEGKNELIVVHNMGTGCTACTMWADGFNGLLKHLESRAAFVLESPDTPAVQRQFALDRGWALKMVSSRGTSFRKDMGYADAKNSPWPGISVFTRKGSQIFRVSDTLLGPGDNFCVAWDFFDLLPSGWSDFGPEYFYSKTQ